MSPRLANATRKLLDEHLAVLQEYARRSLLHGEVLSAQEDEDRIVRLGESMAIGASFKLTDAELVALVLGDTYQRKANCGCFTCRGRRAT